MTYTDGEWVVANWHSGRVVARQPDGSQVTVATAHGPQNAALIAAAPDMLAALEVASEAMHGVCDCGECGGCEATAQIDAAITKARGEA